MVAAFEVELSPAGQFHRSADRCVTESGMDRCGPARLAGDTRCGGARTRTVLPFRNGRGAAMQCFDVLQRDVTPPVRSVVPTHQGYRH